VNARLDYWKIAPEATQRMAAISTYLKESAIEASLRHLVWLRTSQINGCAYCIDLHTHEAFQGGERIQRINCLVAWQETTLFTAQEKAVASMNAWNRMAIGFRRQPTMR
jgi:AhpD family alkylhydroperoxidase